MRKEKLLSLLKWYDPYLKAKKYLDGRLTIERQSPFARKTNYYLTEFTNQYLGSGRWALIKICLMDTQKHDIFGYIKKENDKKYKDEIGRSNNKEMHKEIADFLLTDYIY